jgi:3-deoxy-D-manno-octulosonic acid (KDO) 8-phosphate synthase
MRMWLIQRPTFPCQQQQVIVAACAAGTARRLQKGQVSYPQGILLNMCLITLHQQQQLACQAV